MAKNQESINRSLFELLRSRGYAPTLLDTSGKEIPVPEEAEVFQFKFTKDGEEYGTVTASIDGLHKLVIYFGDDVANSEKEDNGGDDSWYKLLNHLKRFSQQHQLSFEVKNRDHLKYDMAKREHMKKQERIAEGYYPMGKKASYNDNIPTVKIVIEHSRQIEEGEQRYRNVNRIFLENTQGERILAPTTKPGVAQIYARHLAEGGMPHDDRWNHIIGLCEEYNKMGAFVRATRNNQFNESAQQLVNEGINHYQSLRESLSKMRGARGYNAYFESYTPPLMEDESEENNLNELFVQETLDPRIESVMPILNKLHKKVAEMKEVNELSEWADSLTEIALEEGEIYSSPTNEAVIPDPKYDHEPPAQESDPIPDDSDHDPIPDDQEPELDEGMMDTIKKVGGKIFDKLGGGSEKDLIKNLQKSAGVEVTGKKPEFDVKAKELARSNPNNPAGNFMKGGKDLGIFKEDLDEARVFGYDIKRVPDLKVSYDDAQELKNQLGMLQKVMMYATPDDMSPEIRSQVKNIYFKITNILQSNGLQESDLMSTDEGTFDKVKDAVKTVGSKVFDKLGGGSEEDLLRDLKDKAGVRNPENGKPSMAYSDVEKRTDEVDMGQADSSLRNDLKQNNDKMDHFTALGKASKKMGHNHFMDIPDDKLEALRAMVKKFRSGEEVDESALQAYLGDKKYGKDGMKKLRQAGQEDASEKTMQNIRAEFSDKEKPVTEGQEELNAMLRLLGEGLKGEFAGGTLGGVGGTVAGSVLGALAGGPVGAAIGGVVGGAAGGTAGQMAGRELTKEEQLNEVAPLLAAGARAIMPLLAKVGPKLGQMVSSAGKAGAEVAGKTATGIGRGTVDVAKSAAGSAAQNAGQIGVGVGAYQAITDVADKMVGGVGEVYRDVGKAAGAIAQSVGDAIDEKTIVELGMAAVKYSIPIGILLAVLYGGKKLIDQVMNEGLPGLAGAALGIAMDDPKPPANTTPIKTNALQNYVKEVTESTLLQGQEDLDVIKRLIRK